MEEMKEYIDRFQGIQPPHLAFYGQAIRFNLESALASVQFLVQCLEASNTAEDLDSLTDPILDSIQNLLIHTASLSKYFWPISKGVDNVHKKRAQNLRKTFNIKSDSAIRNKDLRNHLEHLDENLDKYLWSKPIVGHVYPAYVGPEMRRDEVPYHFFRAFFTESGIFESLGVRLDIQPIIDEIYEIYRGSPDGENT
jgi:hypothetical protein